MPTKRAKIKPSGDNDLERVITLPLRPIRDDEELDRAIKRIDALIDREELDSGEQDDLEVLSDLVEKYENDHHPLPPVSGAEMLRHLIDSNDITQIELSKETGIAESTISSILTGKRAIGAKHATALARFFSVSPALFLT